MIIGKETMSTIAELSRAASADIIRALEHIKRLQQTTDEEDRRREEALARAAIRDANRNLLSQLQVIGIVQEENSGGKHA